MGNPFYKGIEFRWEEHKRLWNWLSENPGKSKSDWPEWLILEDCLSTCFACEFDNILIENKFSVLYCELCPLTKKGNAFCQTCLDGLFKQWSFAQNEQRSIFAKQIAALPLRDDLDWKTSTGELYGPR